MEWWDNVLPKLEPFISPLVVEEASRGDESASKLRLDTITEFSVLEITSEVQDLAELYFEKIFIPDKARGDAFHLAIATFHGMDFLVSWNFSHILSACVRAVIQEINAYRGILTPIICTPEELMEV